MRSFVILIIITLTYINTALSGEIIFDGIYEVKFGILHVGTVHVKLSHENNLYNVTVEAKTTGIAELVYPVRDYMEAYFYDDLSSFTKAVFVINEGSTKRKDYITWNNKTIKCVRNEKEIKTMKVSDRVFDAVSSHFAFVLGLKRGMSYKEASSFLVIDCKKEIKPNVDYFGISVIKIGEKEYNTENYSIMVPVKGILLSRSEDKRVYLMLDKDSKWLIYALIPTFWGNITLTLKTPINNKTH